MWWVEPIIIQIVSCASAEITLNNKISAYLKIFYEVGRNKGV